ncbi:hypothetical protein AGDE_16256 [Angomonas deanei]|nr:hypothetical protein AGDE_16256 [Angomonas deanei]|eukprot:EPY17422.1 hypothetical protein AGDE_16256 [Angomonas deanei]
MSLDYALGVLRPELHGAARRISRKAYGLQISPSWYALRTVAGSAAKWRRVGDSPWLTVTAGEEGVAVRCNVPLWASKLGGYGLLPRGVAYPKGSDGEPLQLVAQVNFGELWADAAARDGDFEVPATLPSRGVLAFYADGFDNEYLYGKSFEDPLDQSKFRILFFDEELRPLEALLEEYRGGAITSEVLESRVGELLWTREEQYDVFEAYGEANPEKRSETFHMWLEDDVKDDLEQKKLQEVGRRLMWEFPEEGETPPKGIRESSLNGRPKLWYGEVASIQTERALTIQETMRMIPFNSVELSTMLVDAVKSNPSLAKEEWMMEASRYTHWGQCCLEEDERDRDIAQRMYLLGYPDFTQEDPRPCADLSAMLTALKEGKGMEEAEAAALAPLKEDAKGKYILLWQFDSEGDMMWGDCGVCNLFIDPVDLAARRFDRVWYNWDCC